MSILNSDIYRDGGSLSVTYRCRKGDIYTLMLCVRCVRLNANPIDYKIDGYDKLLLYPSYSTSGEHKVIDKSSNSERVITEMIQKKIASEDFDVEESEYTSQQGVKRLATMLVSAIPTRVTC